MPLGTSIFLIAVGAILRFAVTFSIGGIDIQTVGLILLLLGILGVILSLLYMFASDRGRGPAPVDRAPVDREVVRERRDY